MKLNFGKIRILLIVILISVLVCLVAFKIKYDTVASRINKYGFTANIVPAEPYLTDIYNDEVRFDFVAKGNSMGIIEIGQIVEDVKGVPKATVILQELKQGKYVFIKKMTLYKSSPFLFGFNKIKQSDGKRYRLVIKFARKSDIPGYLIESRPIISSVYFADMDNLLREENEMVHHIYQKITYFFTVIPPIDLFKSVALPALVVPILFIALQFVSQIIKKFWRVAVSRIYSELYDSKLDILVRKLPKNYSLPPNASLKGYLIIIYFCISTLFSTFRKTYASIRRYYSTNRSTADMYLAGFLWSSANFYLVYSSNDIVGIKYWTWIFGYILLSLGLAIKRNVHFTMALYLLLLCTLFLLVNRELSAEKAAIFVYFYLCFGALSESDFIKRTKEYANSFLSLSRTTRK